MNASTAVATPSPTPHAAWCQPARCRTFNGGDAIHVHLIGEINGVQVTVERNDDIAPNGRNRYGTPEVYIRSEAAFGFTSDQMDSLIALEEAAKYFAAEIAGVR